MLHILQHCSVTVGSSATQVQQGSFHAGSGFRQKAILTAEVKLNCTWCCQKYHGRVSGVPGSFLQVLQQTASSTDALVTAKTSEFHAGCAVRKLMHLIQGAAHHFRCCNHMATDLKSANLTPVKQGWPRSLGAGFATNAHTTMTSPFLVICLGE